MPKHNSNRGSTFVREPGLDLGKDEEGELEDSSNKKVQGKNPSGWGEEFPNIEGTHTIGKR